MVRYIILQFTRVLIGIYQKTISFDHGPFRHITGMPRCKFYPTCSEYAKEALSRYGIIHGTFKTAGRLLRCNPWSSGGMDKP